MQPPPHDMAWAEMIRIPAERSRLLSLAKMVTVSASGMDAKGERDLLLARAFAHPRDAHIRFVEDTHKYYLHGAQVPLSVTGLYTKYFEEFDATKVVNGCIARWGCDRKNKYYPIINAMKALKVPEGAQKDAIKRAWALNGEHQSALGTALHRAIELALNEEDIPEARARSTSPNLEALVSDEPPGPRDTILAELTGPSFNLPRAKAAAVLDHMVCPDTIGDADREVAPIRTDVVEYQYFLDWWWDNPQLTPIRTEWSLWCSDMQLAGQLDCLMLDLATDEFVLVVSESRPPSQYVIS